MGTLPPFPWTRVETFITQERPDPPPIKCYKYPSLAFWTDFLIKLTHFGDKKQETIISLFDQAIYMSLTLISHVTKCTHFLRFTNRRYVGHTANSSVNACTYSTYTPPCFPSIEPIIFLLPQESLASTATVN